MAFHVRELPQWLVDLDSGNTQSKKKMDNKNNNGSKTQMKYLNLGDTNDHYTPSGENEDRSFPSTSANAGRSTDNNKIVKHTALSPRKQGSRPSRARPEMSSSEDDVKTDLGELQEVVLSVPDIAVDRQVPPIPCKKYENKRNDVKECDGNADLIVKEVRIHDSVCNDSEMGGVKADTNGGAGGDVIADADTGGDAGDNTDAGAGDNSLAGAGTDANTSAGASVDAASAVSGTNIATSNTNSNSSAVARSNCKYGAQCYRKNPEHLQDFSHPGDNDYITVDNRPECQYGLSCYRKNPLHQQHYKHTKKMQKPRQAKRPRKRMIDDGVSSDEDDYDLDDPFIDNGSSDDYNPSDSDSETDFDADEEANSDDPKTNKDSKKLKREHKH